MTLPTTEALREAVERVRARAEHDRFMERGHTIISLSAADTLLAAAGLLLSEEWQGMVEAAKRLAAIAPNFGSNDALIPFEAALSLARKLAAQEEEK